jgi:hypothetical protein
MVPPRNDHGNGKPPRGARRNRDLKPRADDASYNPWPDDYDEPDVGVAQEEGAGTPLPKTSGRIRRLLKPRQPDDHTPWPIDYDEPDADVAQEEGAGLPVPRTRGRIKRYLKPRYSDDPTLWPDDCGDDDAYERVAERMRAAACGPVYEEDEEDSSSTSYVRTQSAAAAAPIVPGPPPKPQPDPRRAARRSVAVHAYDEPDVEEEPPPLDPRSGELDDEAAADVDDDDDDEDDCWDDDEEGERPGVEWARATLAEVLKSADRASRGDIDAKKDTRFFDAHELVQWAGAAKLDSDEEAREWALANEGLVISCYAVLEYAHEPARQPAYDIREVQLAYAASLAEPREERRPKVAERKTPAAKGTRKKVKSVGNLFQCYRRPFLMLLPWMPHVVNWKAQQMKIHDTVGVLALLVHFAHELEPVSKDGKPRAYEDRTCRKGEDGYWWCLYSPQAINKITTMKKDKAQAARDLAVRMGLLLTRRFEGADGVKDHRADSSYVRLNWEVIQDIVWETMPVS